MTDELAEEVTPTTLPEDETVVGTEQGDGMTTPNPLSAALNDPDLQALGNDAITAFLTQRQATMRQQLLDITVGKQLLLVTTNQPEQQKDAQLAQMQKDADSVRATINLIDGALAATPAAAPA